MALSDGRRPLGHSHCFVSLAVDGSGLPPRRAPHGYRWHWWRRTASSADKGSENRRRTISEGDHVRILVSLRNRAFYPRFFHNLFYDCPISPPKSQTESPVERYFIAHLPGSATIPLESDIEAHQRGLHHLGPVTAESSAPFGMFRRRRSLTTATAILVLPEVYPLHRLALVDGLGGQTAQHRISRLGQEPVGSRPYVHGDSRRMIHWRNTARAGRPMVKEVEEETDQTLHILFGTAPVSGSGKETTLEYGIKLAATVANYSLNRNIPVRIWGGLLPGVRVEPAAAARSSADLTWQGLLEALAMVAPGQGTPLSEILTRLPTDANLFFAAPTDDYAAFQALDQRLSTLAGCVVVQLQGFGEPGSAADSERHLDAAGVGSVSCGPGGLSDALTAIQSLGGRTGGPSNWSTPNGETAAPTGDLT